MISLNRTKHVEEWVPKAKGEQKALRKTTTEQKLLHVFPQETASSIATLQGTWKQFTFPPDLFFFSFLIPYFGTGDPRCSSKTEKAAPSRALQRQADAL